MERTNHVVAQLLPPFFPPYPWIIAQLSDATARSTITSSTYLISEARTVLSLSSSLSDSLLVVGTHAAQACGSDAFNGRVTMSASACYLLRLDLGLVREALASCTDSLLTLSTILDTAVTGMSRAGNRSGKAEQLGRDLVSGEEGFLHAIIVSEKEHLENIDKIEPVARKLHTHHAIFSHLQ